MMVELESDVEVRSDGVRQIREELEKALCGGERERERRDKYKTDDLKMRSY